MSLKKEVGSREQGVGKAPHPCDKTLSQREREEKREAPPGHRRALQLHHRRMRQRHDLVQAPGMVGFSHLGVGHIGKRHTGLRVSPGV